jgi:hypothetical protein
LEGEAKEIPMMSRVLVLVVVAIPLSAGAQEEARKCSQCGAGIAGTQKFCGACGARVEAETKPLCAKCGEAGKPGQQFCANCGNRLEAKPLREAPKGIQVRTAIDLPALIQASAVQSGTVCLQAVAFASTKAGGGRRLVTTGTVRQSKEKSSDWSYEATPADRLLVEFANGQTVEFAVRKIEGDFTGDLRNFMEKDHDIAYSAATAAFGTLSIEERRRSGDSNCAITGRVKMEGIEFAVDLKTRVGKFSESTRVSVGDGPSQFLYGPMTEQEIELAGTITAEEFVLKVSERQWLVSISDGDRGSASASGRIVKNEWTLKGVRYEMEAAIARSFKDNRPTRVNTEWKAEGWIVRDGKKYGTLRLLGAGDRGEGAMYKIVLETPEGTIELERYDKN